MCMLDGDTCEVFRDTPRKARKQHRCGCCESLIIFGETYIEHFNIFEGEPTTDRFCVACAAARSEFGKAHGFTPAEGSFFFEALRECVSDEDDDTERWAPMWREVKARMKKALLAAGLKVEDDHDLYQQRPAGWWKPAVGERVA